MFVFQCAHCQKTLKVKEELAGKKVKCPKCGQVVAVPAKVGAPVPNLGLSWLEMPPAKEDRTVPPPPKLELSVSPTNPPGDRRTDMAAAAAPPTAAKHLQTGHFQPQLAETRVADVNPEFTEFLAPPQQADEIGRLGSYRVLKILGNGGMGVVFKAEDPHLERLVALKAMLPELAVSVSAKKRFLREAKAAAGIKHPHVVTIFQVGEDRGAPFLAMEFLEGCPLDEYMKEHGVLPIDDVLHIGRQIADGLAAAHDKKLIHRDIKPANIWMELRREKRAPSVLSNQELDEAVYSQNVPTTDARSRVRENAGETPGAAPRSHERGYGECGYHVKILDFGLARSENDAAHLTQSGAMVGTPAYMAPEQATGAKNVDYRCDLFSLGCVLYRMATGEAPFKGDDTIAILSNIALEEPTLPVLLNPEVPDSLSNLIMQMLAKKPDDRPVSAIEVGVSLQMIEDERTIALVKKQQELSPLVMRLNAIAAAITAFAAMVGSRLYRIAAAVCHWLAPYAARWSSAFRRSCWDPVAKKLGPPADRWIGAPARSVWSWCLAPWLVPTAQWTSRKLAPAAEWTRRKNYRLYRLHPRAYAAVATGVSLVVLFLVVMLFRSPSPVPTPPAGQDLAENDAARRLARNPMDGLDPRNIRLIDLAYVGGGDPDEAPDELVGLLGSTGFRFDVDLTSVAYSPDDQNIAVCGGGGLVAIYNAETAAKLVTCKGHLGKVNALVYSKDGTKLLTGGDDETAIVWDAQTGEALARLEGEKLGAVMSVAFSPDGKRAATAHDVSALVKIWDTASGKDLVTFKGHVVENSKDKQTVASVAFISDGEKVVSAGSNMTLKIWNASTAVSETIQTLNDNRTTSAALSADGKRCAYIRPYEGAVAIVSVPTRKEVFHLPNYGAGRVGFSSAGDLLVESRSGGGYWLKLFDTTMQIVHTFTLPGALSVCAAFDSNGSRIVCACWDRTVRIFDIKSGKEIRPSSYSTGVARLNFNPNGKLLATAPNGSNEPARIWNVADGECLHGNLPMAGQSGCVVFSPDNSRLYLGSFIGPGAPLPNNIRVWNATSGRHLFDLAGSIGFSEHGAGTHSLSFDVKGKLLVSGGTDKLVRIHDALTGQAIKALKGHTSTVSGVSLRPDGKQVASASRDNKAKIWDVAKGEEIYTLKGHEQGVYSITYNPAGDRLVSASMDRTCRIWDADTGKELLVFTAHTGPVHVARFSPDGKRVASCGEENTIRLWDPVTGKQEHFFLKGNVTKFNEVAFSPDGRYLAAAGANGLVYILKLPPLPGP